MVVRFSAIIIKDDVRIHSLMWYVVLLSSGYLFVVLIFVFCFDLTVFVVFKVAQTRLHTNH